MKKKNSPGCIVFIVFITIIVCVAITFLIVFRLLLHKTESEAGQTESEKENGIVQNAYIISTQNDKIEYLYKGQIYQLPGHMDTPYEGIADIEITQDKISHIYTKPDRIEGVLESYTDKQMEVRDYGMIEREVEIPVYISENGTVREGSLTDLIVGSSNVNYVLAYHRIQAILVNEATVAESIRVIIKNDTVTEYPQLYLKSDSSCQISYENELFRIEGGNILDCGKFLDEHGLGKIKIVSEGGGMCICDASGNHISNSYPDTIYCIRTENGIVMVNELPIEEYVKKVLPSEMPQQFGLEALKAQAVCARTYAYSQLKNDQYAMYGANVDDSTAFQVYNKAGKSEITDQAGNETSGQIAVYQGNPITCYYCSTNPGVTEDSELWKNEEERENGQENPEYLQKKYETSENPGDLSDESRFQKFIDSAPDSYDRVSPFYRWTARLDLKGGTDSEFGKAQSISILQRSTNGYVLCLKIQYEKGEKTFYEENEIRNILGHMLQNVVLSNGKERTDLTLIPSACFYIASFEDGHYILKGGGFGHGIGLSQYGASAMASQGMTYEDIMKFYYSGIELMKISQFSD